MPKSPTSKALKRGVRMRSGTGWRLIKLGNSRDKVFVGTLLGTYRFGAKRIAIFSVPIRG